MNLIAKDNKPLSKRLKPEDSCKHKCEKEEYGNMCENTKCLNTKGDLERSREKDSNEELVGSENEASITDNDSDDEIFVFPPDKDISDMLDEVQYNGHFPTITERYFTAYYKINVQSPGDDICIRIHSNRICMLSLAPSHVILQGDDIIKVDFKISDKLDRALNKVSGKSKHGAQPLQVNSNICTVFCSNGQRYPIKCCMMGKLVEINEMLSEKPQLLRELPHRGGYLAIILPNIKHLENLKQSLLTHDQYIRLIEEREKEINGGIKTQM